MSTKGTIRALILMAAICLIAAPVWAVDGAGGVAAGGHNLAGTQGTCSKCHIPHGGKGDKIWAQTLTGAWQVFSGIHSLCISCHRTGGPFVTSSGNASVFTKGTYQNHNMLTWAAVPGIAVVNTTIFPLNTSDTDTIWTLASPNGYTTNSGFYCGSCHNPHKQPFTTIDGNGDYLRVDTVRNANMAAFGGSDARLGACTQCHQTTFTAGISVGHQTACSGCHNPHEGRTVATGAGNSTIAEKILVVPSSGAGFIAAPNIPAWTAGYSVAVANVCVNCHGVINVGVTGRLQDASALILSTLEHHPMGTNAPGGGVAGADGVNHAPGYTAAGELTCTSCHNMHDGTQSFYLRTSAGTYTGLYTDDGTFCTTNCHNNKAVANLGESQNTAHRWTKASNKVTLVGQGGTVDEGGSGQGDCFMCHFIHDGNVGNAVDITGPPNSIAWVDALMKKGAVNLNWSKQSGTAATTDYEDMCAACHLNNTIVGTFGLNGSLLVTSYFSHLFSGSASPSVTSYMALPVNALSLAQAGEYGAPVGTIFCGTCHNVHVQNGGDAQGEMFVKANWPPGTPKSALCIACHAITPMVAGQAVAGSSHPIGSSAVLPTTGVTADVIPAQYGSGGDGIPGVGRTQAGTPGTGPASTDNMVCETCHNFHGSNTSRLGTLADTGAAGQMGKLLIINNSASGLCSTCHTSY